MGRPKLDMSDLIDSNVRRPFHVLNLKGLGSVHEKIDVWTGPERNKNKGWLASYSDKENFWRRPSMSLKFNYK